MRLLPSLILILCAVFCGWCDKLRAQTEAADAARVALALATATHTGKAKASVCDCQMTGVCKCPPGGCACGTGCVQGCADEKADAKLARAFLSYKLAREKIEKDGGRLVVWVGFVCGPCVRQLGDHYHCKVASWEGIDRYGVVLIESKGDGNSYVLKKWDHIPRVEEIRETKLKRVNGRLRVFGSGEDDCPDCRQYTPGVIFAPPPVAPQFAFPRFSGGGGCAGGCCGGGCR